VNARCSPGRILGNHAEDQRAKFFADTFPSSYLSESADHPPEEMLERREQGVRGSKLLRRRGRSDKLAFQVSRDDGEKNYSLRRATIGSVRMARRAGM
jgi:hypothetical protein